jgi:hypothetical protein
METSTLFQRQNTNLVDGFATSIIVRVERGWQSPRTQIVEVDVDGLDVDVFCSLSTMWDNLWVFLQL